MKQGNAGTSIRAAILAILLVVALTAVGYSLAQGTGESPTEAGTDQAGLFGVRILDTGAIELAELGIVPLPPGEQGGLIAHVTAAQLERLRAEGVAFEELGHVAILSNQGNSGLLGSKYGFNDTDVTIPGNSSSWVDSDILISTAPASARVTGVTYHTFIKTGLNPIYCSGEGACGQVQFRICRGAICRSLDSTSTCCSLIAPPPQEGDQTDGTGLLVDYDCNKSGINVSTWNGLYVNGTWSLEARNTCSFYDPAHIDLWYITVYYADPTATPTKTATRTNTPRPTNTPTAVASPTPTCVPGFLRIHKWDDVDRDGVKDEGEPPVAGVPFHVYEEGAARVSVCTTNSEGKCNFTNLCPGRYRVAEGATYCSEPSTPTEQTVDVIEGDWTHVYFGNYPLLPGLEIEKTLTRPTGRHAIVGETVRFVVEYTNTGETTFTHLGFSDDYDPECLVFQYSSIPRTSLDTVLGRVRYENVLDHFGGSLAPGESISVTLTFLAWGYCQPTDNYAFTDGLQDNCQHLMQGPTAWAELYIDPAPCSEAIANGDFETGDGTGWAAMASAPQLMPFVQSADVHGGSYATQLGRCGISPEGTYMPAGDSMISQIFHIPENVDYAPLTFWYKMYTEDWEGYTDFDWFTVSHWTVGGTYTELHTPLGPICENTGWRRGGPIDLTSYRGQDVQVVFSVHQDGNWGCTWAYVDDVELCAQIEGGFEPVDGDRPEGTCWKRGNYTDYAPNGVPDFDMQQADWYNDDGQWNYDAPAAFANSLWWMDSRFEQEMAPVVVPPPAVSDHYDLLVPYGAWDDHAVENVPPFIEDLADYLGTTDEGTTPLDAFDGVLTYLEDQDLDDQYTTTWRRNPSLDWIRSEVLRCEDVMLLLGFWENQADGPKRLGGHWVTAPGVGCDHEPLIGLSDPWFDRAEHGWPGEWRPNVQAHPHPPEPPDTVHNDAAYLSHDVYRVFRTANDHRLAGYVTEYADVQNFVGLNVPADYLPDQTTDYDGGEITTIIEEAIAISPFTDTVILRIDPLLTHVLEGDVFDVELVVDSGEQPVSSVDVHLNFDRSKLRIVNQAGNQTGQIIPSDEFTFVGTNTADNANGRIDFVASSIGTPLSGTFSIATLRFKAVNQAYGTGITIVTSGGRASELLHGGTAIPFQAMHGTVVASEGATLNGDTAMEGRNQGPRWAVPAHVSVYDPAAASTAGSYDVTTNNAGDFQLGGLDMGTFNLGVKGSHTLRSVVSDVALAAGNNPVDFGTLPEGDANNDNRVDLLDVSAVQAAFGTTTGDPAFDPNCDFNEDGSVDISDVDLLAFNFGLVGDDPAGPTVPLIPGYARLQGTAQAAAPSAAEDPVVVELDPRHLEVAPGGVFTLRLNVDSGTRAVDGVQLYLNFDPDVLAVTDAQGNPRGWIGNAGKFDNVITNHTDNATGQIDFVATALQGAKPSGDFRVATIYFKVLRDTTLTRIRFATTEPRFTRVAVGGEYPPVQLIAAQLDVNVRKVSLPLVLNQ